jgi:arylsulfate sulfotransferase
MNHTFGGSLFLRSGIALFSMAAMLVSAVRPQPVVALVSQPAVSSASTKTTNFGETINKLLAEIFAQDNPYGSSPLTALLVFTTETPASVHVRIKGKTVDADIANNFPMLKTQHIIPIYGLYPDYLNTIEVTTTYSTGLVNETTLQLQTKAIEPKSIDQIKIQTEFKSIAALGDGVNFLFTQKLAFDAHGDIRWMNSSWTSTDAVLYNYKSGTYITSYGATFREGDTLLTERNLLGKFLRVWYSPYGVHHDIEEGTDGNLLLAGSKGYTSQDFVYELDVKTGEIIHTLWLRTILPHTSVRFYTTLEAQNSFKRDWKVSVKDWFHLNTILWDDGNVILSGRHSSAVMKIDWPSGEIQWILASPYGWPKKYQKYLLTPLENQAAFEWPYWQHAPIFLPDQDNNPNTTDLLLFDNGTVRFGEADVLEKLRTGNLSAIERYSRMVQYRIDESAGTIEQIWQYGKERGVELYSERCGNVVQLSNGNRMGLFMIESMNKEDPSSHSVISEVDESGNLVWEAMLTSATGQLLEYRAERMPLYHECDQYLWLRQSAQILIPDSVLKANGVQQAP